MSSHFRISPPYENRSYQKIHTSANSVFLLLYLAFKGICDDILFKIGYFLAS